MSPYSNKVFLVSKAEPPSEGWVNLNPAIRFERGELLYSVERIDSTILDTCIRTIQTDKYSGIPGPPGH